MDAQNYKSLSQPERAKLRSKYVDYQNGNCKHCKSSLSEYPPKEIMAKKIDLRRFPINFLRHPVHLHHCHKTGMTIGAVHAYCNAVLWQYHGE